MTVARFEKTFNVYSDDVPTTKANDNRKRSYTACSAPDRAIPNRVWTFTRGAYNFETPTRINSVVTDAFHLNNSEKVFRFNDTHPSFRRSPVPIWEFSPDRWYAPSNVSDEFNYSPISVAPSQDHFVIALGKKLFAQANGYKEIHTTEHRIRSVKHNEEGKVVYWIEFEPGHNVVKYIDISGSLSYTGIHDCHPETDRITSIGINKNIIYAGTQNGDILRGDPRERKLKNINSKNQFVVLNFTFSKFNEHLVAISRASSFGLYDIRKLQKDPVKRYEVLAPKALDFEPTGKPELIVGSGIFDTHLRRVFYETNSSIESSPKIKFGRQICDVKWIDEETIFVGAGGFEEDYTPSERVLNVVKIVDQKFKTFAQNQPLDPNNQGPDRHKVLQLARMGDQMIVLFNRSTAALYTLKGFLKKQVVEQPVKSFLSCADIR